MAALVADVSRVDNLTEKFGRQRLEEGLAYRAESLGSQLAANNNTSDVRLASRHSAWLICERTPAKGKLERRSNQAGKTHSVSRNLLHLSDSESRPVVSEVRIVKVGSSKRNLKRSQVAKPAKEDDRFELVKDRLKIVLKEGDGGLDLSSSSDDELRELNSSKIEATETNFEGNAESTKTRQAGLAKDQGDKDTRRKRNKNCRGSLKKKLKISRPCLDLEKMLARRVESTENDKAPESIFHPIHQM
ncbi:hypothetical protein ACROYT_G021537 [Oculina patagonica]